MVLVIFNTKKKKKKVCLNYFKLMGWGNFFLETTNTPLFLGDFDESQNWPKSKN